MQRHFSHDDAIDRAFDARLARSVVALQSGQRRFQEEMLNFAQWHYDLEDCTLVLSGARGTRTYQITPVATYVREAKEWLWAWANDRFPDVARQRAQRLRELYVETHYRIFDLPAFDLAEEEIGEICALAVSHLGASGVFKCESDSAVLCLAVERLLKEEASMLPEPSPGAVDQ